MKRLLFAALGLLFVTQSLMAGDKNTVEELLKHNLDTVLSVLQEKGIRVLQTGEGIHLGAEVITPEILEKHVSGPGQPGLPALLTAGSPFRIDDCIQVLEKAVPGPDAKVPAEGTATPLTPRVEIWDYLKPLPAHTAKGECERLLEELRNSGKDGVRP